jgi:RNA polymerase sigma-70 factor, ECF subfamily
LIEPAALGDLSARRRHELLEAFASEPAFRDFYERSLPRVYGYLVPRCGGDHSLAEELTQDVFTGAVAQRRAFNGHADPLTWIIAIARRRLADHFRRLDREEHRRLRVVVREVSVADGTREWQNLEDRAAILRTLATLPALHRAVLLLHYADGLSIREIGEHLARSESAVESLLTHQIVDSIQLRTLNRAADRAPADDGSAGALASGPDTRRPILRRTPARGDIDPQEDPADPVQGNTTERERAEDRRVRS